MTKTITATVQAGQFRELLTDLLRTAGVDDTLPMLKGVRLHADKIGEQAVIAGFSTDRFTMGQAHINATGHLPEIFLPASSCKRALAVLKLLDPAALLELAVSGDPSSAAGDGALSFAGDGLSAHLPTAAFDFPQVHRIFDALTKLEPAAGGTPVVFEPKFFARFVALAKARRERLQVVHTTVRNAALITVGANYRGLIMPVLADAVDVPWLLAPSERAAIKKAKADQAAAKAKADAERKAAELKAKRSAAAKKAAATRVAKRATQTTSRAKRKAA